MRIDVNARTRHMAGVHLCIGIAVAVSHQSRLPYYLAASVYERDYLATSVYERDLREELFTNDLFEG